MLLFSIYTHLLVSSSTKPVHLLVTSMNDVLNSIIPPKSLISQVLQRENSWRVHVGR